MYIVTNKYHTDTCTPHQANEYSQDLHHIIPLDWKVHQTPSGYMDRYRWIKSMTQFSNILGSHPVNNQIQLFVGRDNHFDDRALTEIQSKKIQPFILKTGDLHQQPAQ